VRLVRVGGRYLGGREQRLWVALAALLGLATIGIILAFENPGAGPLYLGAGVAAVLTALRLGGPVTRRLRNVRKGRLVAGELSGPRRSSGKASSQPRLDPLDRLFGRSA